MSGLSSDFLSLSLSSMFAFLQAKSRFIETYANKHRREIRKKSTKGPLTESLVGVTRQGSIKLEGAPDGGIVLSLSDCHDTNVTISMADVEGYLVTSIFTFTSVFEITWFVSTSHCHKKKNMHKRKEQQKKQVLQDSKARIIIRIFKVQDPDLSFRPKHHEVMSCLMGEGIFHLNIS